MRLEDTVRTKHIHPSSVIADCSNVVISFLYVGYYNCAVVSYYCLFRYLKKAVLRDYDLSELLH